MVVAGDERVGYGPNAVLLGVLVDVEVLKLLGVLVGGVKMAEVVYGRGPDGVVRVVGVDESGGADTVEEKTSSVVVVRLFGDLKFSMSSSPFPSQIQD